MRKTVLAIIIIFIFGLFAIRALLSPGFYTSHDGQHHLTRMANYYLALKDGQLPPRWAPNFNGHLGSPIFVLIYPLPYMLGVTLHSFNFTFANAFKIAIGVSYLLSGIFFYLWLKPKLGTLPALIGALFYLWAPYRFLMIFVRGAYPESLAYTFVPLLFLAIDRITESKNRRYIGLGSIVAALLLLSQNLVALIFLSLAAVYTVFKFSGGINRTALARLLGTILLGFSISAFIYLPDTLELKYTQYSRLMNYSQDNFVYLWQLLRSPWGYGFSISGPNDGMSFQIGLTQLMVVLLTFISGLYLFLKTRAKLKMDGNFSLWLFALLTFASAVFLMTESPLTHIVWQTIPGLNTIDYPWRLLGVTVFTTAIMAAWLISHISDRLKVPLTALFIILLLLANRNFLRVNQKLDLSDNYLLSYTGKDTHLGEFTPKGRITVDPYPYPRRGEFYDGAGTIDKQIISPTYQRFELSVSPKEGLSKFRIPTLYFPGWRVFLDGQEVSLGKNFEVTGGIDLKNNVDVSGMMGIMLPSGKHSVEAKFSETQTRLAGNWLSLASLGACLGILLL